MRWHRVGLLPLGVALLCGGADSCKEPELRKDNPELVNLGEEYENCLASVQYFVDDDETPLPPRDAPDGPLRRRVNMGSRVRITFRIREGAPDQCRQMSLAAYRAPAPEYIADRVEEQVLFDVATVEGVTPGVEQELSVKVPDCNFQVDYVFGAPITQFRPGQIYGRRKVSWDVGPRASDPNAPPDFDPERGVVCPAPMCGENGAPPFECEPGGKCETECGTSGTTLCDTEKCEARCEAPRESCNRTDDNCNGVIDEGFWAAAPILGIDDMATLRNEHGDCGTGNRTSPECYAASRRFCRNRTDGCFITGFGVSEFRDHDPGSDPGEYSYQIACLGPQAAEERIISIKELPAYHEECTPASMDTGRGQELFSRECTSAFNRYCIAEGFVGGIGPIEMDPYASNPTVLLACVRPQAGQQFIVPFEGQGGLASFHGGCNDVSDSRTTECAAAAMRYCTSKGFAVGFTPPESVSTQMAVLCVRSGP